MPMSECENCGNTYEWQWSEAFDKFGFNDGDGLVETPTVATVLRKAGYEVVINDGLMHNSIIISITKDGMELIPDHVRLGYDNPYEYLPEEVMNLLDDAF